MENKICTWKLGTFRPDKKNSRNYEYMYFTECGDNYFDTLFGKLKKESEYRCPKCNRVIEFNTKNYPKYEYDLNFYIFRP